MDMFRVTARWSGFPGAPGYSNFFFNSGFLDGGVLGDEAQMLAERVREAFYSINLYIPYDAQISIEAEVPVIDSDSGVIQSFNTIEPPDPVESMGSSSGYAGPAGGVITWRTNDLRNGRRIRGRTFLVPFRDTAYEPDGTLRSEVLEKIREFGDTLMGGSLEGDLGVWSRPVNGSGGVFATVTGYSVPDMAAVLRSRRD